MKPLMIYDITRLWARRNAETPTGIDRVDINYALHFVTSSEFEAVFVIQNGEQLRMISEPSARIYILSLHKRWMEGNSEALPQIVFQDDVGGARA